MSSPSHYSRGTLGPIQGVLANQVRAGESRLMGAKEWRPQDALKLGVISPLVALAAVYFSLGCFSPHLTLLLVHCRIDFDMV